MAVNGVSGDAGMDSSIAKMEEVFNKAAEKSAEITEKSTIGKVKVDAAKQRPL